ncbi:cell wall metabolism sensor histidine kinase WalK [Kibdelosporangium persicum]|uniref:histidine kinase n=1 Tax=Kibdelosporangium persicum TaxID=2698649 RepID=A0ABX2FGT6_9PSEU|nr:HAMP domain-containing sensor histidine kinase [Kibdelosporangium persicum]NRN70601.1 Integral membrane sensor signal transduction histidine kinase [Kibdelosporangium persicum]
MRRSVFVRLLAVAALVALCSIATTAWLAAQLTRTSIERDQGQKLATDNQIYASLLTHATQNRDWGEAGQVVRTIAEWHGNRRIVLVAKDGNVLADVGGDRGPLPATPSAVVDPLAVDPVLVPDAPADRIDERVLGPFRTPMGFRGREDHGKTLSCLRARKKGLPTKDCQENLLPPDTAADFSALLALEDLADACLTRKQLPSVELNLDFTPATGVPGPDKPAVAACVTASRKEQLTPYVAPPALLYLMSPSGTPTTAFDVTGNGWQVVGAAAAVLVVAVGVTAFAGARITRPLRALTAAAQHMSDGGEAPPVRVSGQDEIAGLAKAFNTMAAKRAQLEQARKAMVNDIAHELRTPLSNIRGWLEAAQDGISDRDPALIALLHKEALVLQHVVDDLQDLAIADAGALRLAVEPLAAGAVLAQVRAAHEARAAEAGVALTTEAPQDLVVMADPLRLRQILDNLVANAVRYSPGGSVAISASRQGHEVAITVADTGMGIAAEDLPYVFDRFWRADKSRTRSTGGSGLGLAIVRKLAEAQGGSVDVASTLGEGTTFTLRLPS